MQLTLRSYIDGVNSGILNPQTVVDFYVKKAKTANSKLFSFVRFDDEYVQQNISSYKEKPLHAAPIAIKDIILTK